MLYLLTAIWTNSVLRSKERDSDPLMGESTVTLQTNTGIGRDDELGSLI